jgi:hypothetical protein
LGLAVTLATTLNRMVTKYGREFTLRRVTKGPYDPLTSQPSETATDEPVIAMVLDPGQYQMAGSLIVRDRAGVLIPALDDTGTERTAPGSDDRIVDDLTGAVHEIGRIRPIDIQGGPIGWACDLGR